MEVNPSEAAGYVLHELGMSGSDNRMAVADQIKLETDKGEQAERVASWARSAGCPFQNGSGSLQDSF